MIKRLDGPSGESAAASCGFAIRSGDEDDACIVMVDARDRNVDFFKKLGYSVYCTLEDYPNGYNKYKLQKRL